LCLVALSGCVRYQPKPIYPARLEKDFRSRTLDAPGLRAYAEAHRRPPGAWPPAELDLAALTLVACYYHPELDVARARVRLAEAALITAGARPNPSLATGAGYSNSPESPIVFQFEAGLLIETARKRSHRLLRAQKLIEVSKLALTEAAWQARSRVRAALTDRVLALRRLEVLEAEEKARAEAVAVLKQRLKVGEVSRPDVDAVRAELSNVRVATHAAKGQAAESLVRLAAAAGLPVATLAHVPVRWAEEAPPALEALPLARVQEAGLLNRIDVRRLLLEYDALEAALQLEIARQYPDFQLLPGHSFEEGHYRITLGLALPLPLRRHTRGPIAEAEARRLEGRARFLALQAQAIAEMESALARYGAALEEFQECERQLLVLQRERERAVRRAVEVGEEDRLALAGVRVQTAVLAKTRVEALAKAQAALGALEDAVQRALVEQKEGLP
jgi:outer membrane protein TolC